jgi:hypothetical protein
MYLKAIIELREREERRREEKRSKIESEQTRYVYAT